MSTPGSTALADDLRSVLEAWVAPSADQEALRLAYLDHLDAHADAVWRAGPPEHFTASCLVLDEERSHVLLTLHTKAQRWFQLGGHLEGADTGVAAAALREAAEESGLRPDQLHLHPAPVQLDRHVLVGAFGRCREHLDVRYAAVASPGAEVAISEESLDLAWWPVAALPEQSRDELTPLVTAAMTALG